jgi:hypothetical protein
MLQGSQGLLRPGDEDGRYDCGGMLLGENRSRQGELLRPEACLLQNAIGLLCRRCQDRLL